MPSDDFRAGGKILAGNSIDLRVQRRRADQERGGGEDAKKHSRSYDGEFSAQRRCFPGADGNMPTDTDMSLMCRAPHEMGLQAFYSLG